VAAALGVRADVLAEAGHWQEAATVFARGLAARERQVGREHDELVPFLMQGAKALAHLGRDAEAAAWVARARAIATKTQARASWTHYLRYTEAFTLELAGKDAAAAAAYAESAAELEKVAPESEEVGLALAGVARREERRGRCREALRLYDRALAALAVSSGPQSAMGMSVRAGRASCLVELGQAGAARSEAGAIVAFAEASGNIPDTAATAHFVLARLEPDRAAARALAERALEGLTDDNARDRENRRQIERWLQRR
jgi:tetratricopeptide (TPR) repeat protein